MNIDIEKIRQKGVQIFQMAKAKFMSLDKKKRYAICGVAALLLLLCLFSSDGKLNYDGNWYCPTGETETLIKFDLRDKSVKAANMSEGPEEFWFINNFEVVSDNGKDVLLRFTNGGQPMMLRKDGKGMKVRSDHLFINETLSCGRVSHIREMIERAKK